MKLAVKIMICGLLCCSCSEKPKLGPKDYVRYIEGKSNGFKKEIEVGDLIYTFSYKPIEYVALKEMQDPDDTSTYAKRLSELSKTVWFNVYLKPKNGSINPVKNNVSDLDDYNYRLSYFLTQAGKNFELTYGDKSAKCIAYHFENNYGLTPMDVMVVGFEISDTQPIEDILLEYNDILFNTGVMKIKISKDQLNQIPQLIL